MSNLPSNSLQEGEHNLQEMKTKSQAWSSKGYHMYVKMQNITKWKDQKRNNIKLSLQI